MQPNLIPVQNKKNISYNSNLKLLNFDIARHAQIIYQTFDDWGFLIILFF